jgi:hypothetical protein
VKLPPDVVSPVVMFVTTTGPVTSAHEMRAGLPGMTMISVAETETTDAEMPARLTATGASKPWPKIVTC